MREIKFRGKTLYGEWVYGYYAKKLVGKFDQKTYWEELRDFIITDFSSGGVSHVEVIPETLGQFTGLHDKNGKEIYEGDMLKACSNGIQCVGLVYYEDAQWFGACDYLGYAVMYGGAEVIGNIYENPEMVKP